MVIDSPLPTAADAAATTAASATAARAAVVAPSYLLVFAETALAAYAANPGGEAARRELAAIRARAAASIAALSAAQRAGRELEAARELLKSFAASGASDYAVSDAELAQADAFRRQGWPGLLAAMLLAPAWQWQNAPQLDDVPPWLWEDYTRYLFATPQGFTAVGDAENYAAHILRRLEQLAGLAAANRGSSAVRAALAAYLETENTSPLHLSARFLRRHYELRGRILSAAHGLGRSEPMEAFPRAGRRLRIGFVARQFDAGIASSTTLPLFEHLDPERFDVALFVQDENGGAIENQARRRAGEFSRLGGDAQAQADALRLANLDVVVFSPEAASSTDAVTTLGLHRVAPLQMVADPSGTTSGLPEIDLYLSGTLNECDAAAAQFTERLALLPGPALTWRRESQETEAADAGGPCTRSLLGLPEEAVVFVSALRHADLLPEMRQTWGRLLAAVPGSILFVQLLGAASGYDVKRFCAEFDRELGEQGIDPDRLHVSPTQPMLPSGFRNLLKLADVYLAPFPVSDLAPVLDALEVGLPVVAREGDVSRSRHGAAMLRSLDAGELIATDDEGYIARGAQLGGNREHREAVQAKIGHAMERVPVFLDTLAASDAFGGLALRAWDELADNGREVFRQSAEPFCPWRNDDPAAAVAASDRLLEASLFDEAREQAELALAAQPASAAARQAMARALSARGNHARAADYLIAAVQAGGAAAALWRELAGVLQQAGNGQAAITALETSLRVDPSDVESWSMLGNLASQCGHAELLREVAEVMQKLAPDDPRTLSLATSGRVVSIG